MLLIRAWLRNQGEGVRRVLVERARRAEKARPPREPKLLAPFSLTWVRLAADFDADFMDFASACPPAVAPEFAWIRTIQYAATHDPIIGGVRVTREAFGNRVLSTNSRTFAANVGALTYDALATSRLVIPYTRDAARAAEDAALLSLTRYTAVRDGCGAVTAYVIRDGTRDGTDDHTEGGTGDGTGATRVPQNDDDDDDDDEGSTPAVSSNGHGVANPRRSNGNGGGMFASLSKADQAVARAVVEWMRKPARLPAERDGANRVHAMIRAGTLTAEQGRDLIDRAELNPELTEVIRKVRLNHAMSRSQRRETADA